MKSSFYNNGINAILNVETGHNTLSKLINYSQKTSFFVAYLDECSEGYLFQYQ